MASQNSSELWQVVRFKENPIITPYLTGDTGDNINGPSLIRVPEWVSGRLGNYYLYFAHHEGKHIRLAYSDTLQGPWKIYTPGILPCSQLPWNPDHIASPDVVIDEEQHIFRLYFHTPVEPMLNSEDPEYYTKALNIRQISFVATSSNGLNFSPKPASVGHMYLRVWHWHGHYYALARGGAPLYRSADGYTFEETISPFSRHPNLFANIRHVAVWVRDNQLTVFYSNIGDAPERIWAVGLKMTANWTAWEITEEPVEILRPETGYEGAHLPVTPSRFGSTYGFENGVRDPFVYYENGSAYLLYSIVGERGIAIAELHNASGACLSGKSI